MILRNNCLTKNQVTQSHVLVADHVILKQVGKAVPNADSNGVINWMKITLEQDENYFRVVLKEGTHKLHSEKLNLETAFELAYKFKKNIMEDGN